MADTVLQALGSLVPDETIAELRTLTAAPSP